MQDPWITTVCRSCPREVTLRKDWTNPPTKCHHCRIREIQDLVGLLERFLNHERQLSSRHQQPQDKALWESRAHLRGKAVAALRLFSREPQALADHCASSVPLRALVYQMNRDKRRTEAPKRGGRTTPSRIHSIVQGGAVGLGKRS